MLNLAPIEMISLVKRLPYFDSPIELHVFLVGIHYLGVHDLIEYGMFNVVKIEF